MVRAFAGPLCCYYAAADQSAATVRKGIEVWREDLVGSLEGRVDEASLRWPEEPDGPVAWGDMGESGWMALRLLAYYAERTDLDFPDTVPQLLELDREYRQAVDEKFARSRYGQLLPCSVWLPSEFPITVQVPMPDGETAEIGSLPGLHNQLRWLNERTFQASLDATAEWVDLPAPAGGELIPAAQRGFAVLWGVVAEGVRNGMPVLVG